MKSKKTNYEAFREYIVQKASDGCSCYDCKARTVCRNLSKEKGIFKTGDSAPCHEAWVKWASMEADK